MKENLYCRTVKLVHPSNPLFIPLDVYTAGSLDFISLDVYDINATTVCFFEVRFFWQLWPVGCAGCTDLGCFWQTTLVRNLGSNFFSGPRYVVNPYCLLSDEL